MISPNFKHFTRHTQIALILSALFLLPSNSRAEKTPYSDYQTKHSKEVVKMQIAIRALPADWTEKISPEYEATLNSSYEAAERAMTHLNQWEDSLNRAQKQAAVTPEQQLEFDQHLKIYEDSMKALARIRLNITKSRKQEALDQAKILVKEASLICDIVNRLSDSERDIWLMNAYNQALDHPDEFKKKFIVEGVHGIPEFELLFRPLPILGEIECIEEEIRLRQQAIEKILCDVKEINAVFKDILLIVRRQDESLRKIEKSLENTKRNMEAGLKELKKAEKIQKKQFSSCCFFGF